MTWISRPDRVSQNMQPCLDRQGFQRQGLIQSPIFPVLLIASKDWMENPKQAHCYVQFHPLVTASINHISYRHYDYLTYMAYKHRLSRWIHKRLAHITSRRHDASLQHQPQHHPARQRRISRRARQRPAARSRNRPDELKAKQVVMEWKKAENGDCATRLLTSPIRSIPISALWRR